MKLKDLIKKYGDKEISTEQEQAITKQLGIKTVWKPECGEVYWYLTDTGILGKAEWRPTISDELRYKLSNCYRTADDAEIAYQKLLVTAELKQFMEEHNTKIDCMSKELITTYSLQCDFLSNMIMVRPIVNYGSLTSDIYFTDKQTAEEAIDVIGLRRLVTHYFGVNINVKAKR